MRKSFKILISTVAAGLILAPLIPAMPKKQKKSESVEIKEALSILSTIEAREEDETKVQENALDIEEITGLIIEKTMTKVGYEFYENFFILWEPPERIKGYNIYINEMASPMWGSLVYVNVNDALVWNAMIKPRSEDVEIAVRNSIDVVKNYLYQYEEIRRQLEKGDMIGDGIY